MDRGFDVSGHAGGECQFHLPGALRRGDAGPPWLQAARCVMRNAEEMCGLVIQPQRLQWGSEGPRLAIQDPMRFVTHGLGECSSQRMLEQLPDDQLVPMQQRRTESVEESEHVKPPHLL